MNARELVTRFGWRLRSTRVRTGLALGALVLVLGCVVWGRALLAASVVGAELSLVAVGLDLAAAVVACGVALLLRRAGQVLGSILGGLFLLAYALLFAANMEMAAAMDTLVHLQDITFAADEVFIRGSALQLAFPLFTMVFVLAAIVGGVALSLVPAPDKQVLIGAAAVTLAFLGTYALTARMSPGTEDWQHAGLVGGSLGVSLRTPSPLGPGPVEGEWLERPDIDGPSQAEPDSAVRPQDDERDAAQRDAVARFPGRDRVGESETGPRLVSAPEEPRNILLVIVEGIPGVYLEQVQRERAVDYEVTMPAFSAIAEEGLVVPDSIAHARQTIRGLYSIFTGDYPRLDLTTPKIYPYMEAAAEARPPALPALMSELGYRSIYLQAADLGYMSKDRFMTEAGFDTVKGKEFFTYQHVPFEWGPDDKAYFEQVADYIAALEADDSASDPEQDPEEAPEGDEPWFLSLLTVGTHHPYGVTDEYAADFPNRKMASVAYLDEALGEFMERLDRDGVLDDTAVFFVSDESHGVTGHPLGRFWGTTVLRAPELSEEVVNPGAFGLVDVPRSILDYLGEDEAASRFPGRSIVREYDEPRTTHFGQYVAKADGHIYHPRRGDTVERLSPARPGVFAQDYERETLRTDDIPDIAEALVERQSLAHHVPAVEYGIAEDVPADAAGGTWRLVADADYGLPPGEEKLLTSAQYLDIPEDSEVTVRISLEVPAADARPDTRADADPERDRDPEPGPDAVWDVDEPETAPAGDAAAFALQLLAEYEPVDVDLPAIPRLAPGESHELDFSFRADRRLERTWLYLQARSLLSELDVPLRVEHVVIEVTPPGAGQEDNGGAAGGGQSDSDEGGSAAANGDAADSDEGNGEAAGGQEAATDSSPDASEGEGPLPAVAHAGGAYRGRIYTNSLQALEANADQFELFELDFQWTADRRLVGLHSWDVIFPRHFGFEPDEPLSYDEFQELEPEARFTPLDLDMLGTFLDEQDHARIVTDIKEDNTAALEKMAKRIDDAGRRLVPQIYQPGELDTVLELDFERFIWTLYRYPGNRDFDRVTERAAAWRSEHGDRFKAVAMPIELAEEGLAERLEAEGVPTYAHTVNSCEEVARLRELGIDAVYTDELGRGACR